jgi:hypothetical protein
MRYMYENNHPQLPNVTYLEYIQSYGGPGMAGIISPEIEAGHAYTISILPVTKERGSTNWVTATGIGLMGLSFAGGIACGFLTVGTAGIGGLICGPLLAGIATAGTELAAGGLTYDLIQRKYAPSPEVPEELKERYAQGIPLEDMFEERELSSIYLSELKIGQKFCSSGDIAGE